MTVTKRRRSPEKQTQRAIVNNLRTMGFRVSDLTQPRRTMMPLGLPDLYVSHGRFHFRCWIECKAPERRTQKNGGLSTEQLQWIRDERAAGGDVIVAYELNDVLDGLRRRKVIL